MLFINKDCNSTEDKVWSRYRQGGITCGAIDEPWKSSKAIDERVIINFPDKNVVMARFCDKNGVFIIFIYMYIFFNMFYLFIYIYMYE